MVVGNFEVAIFFVGFRIEYVHDKSWCGTN